MHYEWQHDGFERLVDSSSRRVRWDKDQLEIEFSKAYLVVESLSAETARTASAKNDQSTTIRLFLTGCSPAEPASALPDSQNYFDHWMQIE